MAALYPAMIRLDGQPCLVVGGGKVAERKIHSLLAAAGRVKVISPTLTPDLQRLAAEGQIEYAARCYGQGDADGNILVISATNDPQVNRLVAQDCRRFRILLNAVDDPENCSFYVPAVVRRGDLLLTVSTGGKSPLLARKIRAELERLFGDVFGEFVEYLGEKRSRIIREALDEDRKIRLLEDCLRDGVLTALHNGDLERAKELVESVTGSSRP